MIEKAQNSDDSVYNNNNLHNDNNNNNLHNDNNIFNTNIPLPIRKSMKPGDCI